jgi:Uma2 family endonuclease
MPEVLEQTKTKSYSPSDAESYTSTFYENVYYPEEREDDMGETSIHIKLIADLLTILKNFFNERRNVFVTSNMNIYYKKGNPRRWFAPDLLVAFDIPNVERSSYLLWREGIFPQVVFEVASEKTWRNDLVEKLELYDDLGAEEYYILDPESAYLPEPLTAFERQNNRLVKKQVEGERVLSPRMGLEIVRTENSFRLFEPQAGEFLLTLEEAENELKILRAQIEKLKEKK